MKVQNTVQDLRKSEKNNSLEAKRNLYIIGASNFGREIESWLNLLPEEGRDWILKGFLHSFEGESPLANYPSDYSIIGDWANFDLSKEDYCIIAVADVTWKEKIYNALKNKVTFFTYIAPNSIIGKFNQIGEGSIICPNVLISTNVSIGKCVTINFGTEIGHDVEIGAFSSIMPKNCITGNVQIGNNVFSGAGALFIPKVKVNNFNVIGAGSVVVTDVIKENVTLFGNPARIIGTAK